MAIETAKRADKNNFFDSIGHFETKSDAASLPPVGPVLLHDLTFCTLRVRLFSGSLRAPVCRRYYLARAILGNVFIEQDAGLDTPQQACQRGLAVK